MKIESWSYNVWHAFQNKVYGQSITQDDFLEKGEVNFFETVFKIDSERNMVEWLIEPVDLRDVVLAKKGSERYLIPLKLANQCPLKPVSWIECRIKKSDTKLWRFLTEAKTLSVSGEKYYSLKELMDLWNPQEHTEPKHWLFLKLLMLASIWKGIRLCLCSEPNCGKGSNWTVLNNVTRNIGQIQKPTLAKFETTLFYNKVIVPDELTSMKSDDARELESVILAIADNRPEYVKHSMSRIAGMNVMDVMQKSIIFTYNRPQDLNKKDNFFDQKWENISAFRSRYPQLLIKGHLTSKLDQTNEVESSKVLEDNFEEMRKVSKTLVYYSKHLSDFMHGYKLPYELSNRHHANLKGLFDVLDAYSATEEEWLEWCKFVMEAINGYKSLLKGEIQPEDTITMPKMEVKEVSMAKWQAMEDEII